MGLTKAEYTRDYHQRERDRRHEVHEEGGLKKVTRIVQRKRVLDSLELFLSELFPELFSDPFGEVQRDSIAQEQHVLESGVGLLNKLEPRGYGKSTRSILSAVWSCLKGVQDFVLICCDSVDKSSDLLKIAHKSLAENDDLLELFPELLCFRLLENNTHRCQYQTYKGKPTKISIKGDTICFPELGGQFASEGAIIVSRPFKKSRGKNIDGRRPSVVILDDVQSSEDAMSPTSTAKNIQTLKTDIACLGTPKNPVAIINNATIIRDDDYPSRVAAMRSFTTVRYKMLESFPTDVALWEEYQGIRQTFDTGSAADKERAAVDALEFYVANRKAMDEGASATWDHAYSTAKQEVSTIQSAQNFIADFGRESFDSELQNTPQEETVSIDLLTIRDIMRKTNHVPAGIVPNDCGKLVAMIDVHEEILDFELWGFDQYFGGAKILGGTWPDQRALTFAHQQPPKPLSLLYPKMSIPARLNAALEDLFAFILGREFLREDGVPMRVSRCLVDSNGFYSDDIKRTCRGSKFATILTPSYGKGIGARRSPISQWEKVRGRKDIGPEWTPTKPRHGELSGIVFDTNYWKTRLHKQIAQPKGDRGSLSLHAGSGDTHRRSAEGYRAEKPVEVAVGSRVVQEWQLIPGGQNHPLDCAVGCLVAASFEGITTHGSSRNVRRNQKAVRYL